MKENTIMSLIDSSVHNFKEITIHITLLLNLNAKEQLSSWHWSNSNISSKKNSACLKLHYDVFSHSSDKQSSTIELGQNLQNFNFKLMEQKALCCQLTRSESVQCHAIWRGKTGCWDQVTLPLHITFTDARILYWNGQIQDQLLANKGCSDNAKTNYMSDISW